MLGLPDHVTACLFDLDGVLTSTAAVHRAAWEETFNDFLRRYAAHTGRPYVPFDPDDDYYRYVDGKPRLDGVTSFLTSRGITLPVGHPDEPGEPEAPGTDAPGGEASGGDVVAATTASGLGNRKNALLLRLVREHGVEPFPGSVAYLRAAEKAGLRRAVVSASANCREVVQAAGLADLLEVRVDGVTARRENLPGKPAPDTFLAAAAQLGVPPEHAAVFEDAQSGVAAGRAGGFGFVVGVNRVSESQADALFAHGADKVVRDLAELLDGERQDGKLRDGAANDP